MERKETSKRRSKRSYYDDYRKNASGDYIYVGALYEFRSQSGKSANRWSAEMLILSVLVFAVLFAPGFFFVPGLDHSVFVLLPYGIGVLLSGYFVVCMIRLAATRGNVKALEYDRVVHYLPRLTRAVLIIGAVAFVGEIVYVIINGVGGMVFGMIYFLVSCVISVGLSCLMVRNVKDAEWVKVSGK